MSDIDLDAIRAREKAASQEVYRLCQGGRFTMTVPPREATDSDTVIIAALEDIDALLAEVKKLTAERDDARDAFESIKEESAYLQAEYGQPAKAREMQCGSCSQHETVDKKDAAARALAKTARRYKRERNEALDESARAYSQGVEDMRAKVADRIFADEQKCQAAINANPTNPHLSGRLRGLQRARDIATDPAPDTCTSRSTFGPSGTRTCELPADHQGLHRSGDGTWTDDGADKEPAPAPDLEERVDALEEAVECRKDDHRHLNERHSKRLDDLEEALRRLGVLTDSRAARRGRRI